jgi:hypothetical protein
MPFSINETDCGSNLSLPEGRPVVRSTSQHISLPQAGEDYDDVFHAALSQHKVIRIEHAEQVRRPYMRSYSFLEALNLCYLEKGDRTSES